MLLQEPHHLRIAVQLVCHLHDIVLFIGTISGLIVKDTVRDHIRNQDLNLREAVMVMRTTQSKLNQMISQCPDGETAIAIKKLSEEVRFSDSVSSLELTEIEKELTVSVDDLQQALVDGDFASVDALCNRANQIYLKEIVWSILDNGPGGIPDHPGPHEGSGPYST